LNENPIEVEVEKWYQYKHLCNSRKEV
jgi:hypothetical protein